MDELDSLLSRWLGLSRTGRLVRIECTDYPLELTPEQAERMADVLAEMASRAAANRADAFPSLYPQKGK